MVHSARTGVLNMADDAVDPARSEAQEARDAFAKLASGEQAAVTAFLKSLVNFSPDR